MGSWPHCDAGMSPTYLTTLPRSSSVFISTGLFAELQGGRARIQAIAWNPRGGGKRGGFSVFGEEDAPGEDWGGNMECGFCDYRSASGIVGPDPVASERMLPRKGDCSSCIRREVVMPHMRRGRCE